MKASKRNVYLLLVLTMLVVVGFVWKALSPSRVNDNDWLGCRQNLQRIGMAIEAYAGSNSHLPQAAPYDSTHLNEERLGWLVPTMAYLEASNPSAGLNVTHSVSSLAKQGMVKPIPILTCPASHSAVPGDGNGVSTQYVGIAGVGRDAIHFQLSNKNCGVFGYRRIVRYSDVTDGVGNTMMVIETKETLGAWIASGRPTIREVDPARRPYIGDGRPFGGLHSKGALSLFADGSVRPMSQNTHYSIIEAVSTIAGNERVGLD